MSARRRNKNDTLQALLRLKAATSATASSATGTTSHSADDVYSNSNDDAYSHTNSEYNGSLDVNAMASEDTTSHTDATSNTDASSLSTASSTAQTPVVNANSAPANGKDYMHISEDNARSNKGALRATYVRELLLGSLSL